MRIEPGTHKVTLVGTVHQRGVDGRFLLQQGGQSVVLCADWDLVHTVERLPDTHTYTPGEVYRDQRGLVVKYDPVVEARPWLSFGGGRFTTDDLAHPLDVMGPKR